MRTAILAVLFLAMLPAPGLSQDTAKSPLERLYTEPPTRLESERSSLPVERAARVPPAGSRPLDSLYGSPSATAVDAYRGGGRGVGGGVAPGRPSSALGSRSTTRGLQTAPGARSPSPSTTGLGPRKLGYGDAVNPVGPSYRSQQGLGRQRGPGTFRSGGRGVGGGRR